MIINSINRENWQTIEWETVFVTKEIDKGSYLEWT